MPRTAALFRGEATGFVGSDRYATRNSYDTAVSGPPMSRLRGPTVHVRLPRSEGGALHWSAERKCTQ